MPGVLRDEEVVLLAGEETPEEVDWRSASFMGVCTFVAEGGASGCEWEQVVTAFDSMAMVTCVLRSCVGDDWVWIQRGGCRVRGISGEETKAIGKVLIPSHAMVYQGRRRGLVASVVEAMPRGIQLLVGLPVIRSPNYRLVLDVANCRVYARAVQEVIRLDDLAEVVNRRLMAPGYVLSLCAGLLVELYVMLELGFRVAVVLVVERSILLREMLVAVHGSRVRVLAETVEEFHQEMVAEYGVLLAAFAGPTCTPWSRLAEAPKGRWDEAAGVFRLCAGLMRYLAEDGCLCWSLMETVVVHGSLLDDEAWQEDLAGGEFVYLCASKVGSGATRGRRYCVRGADVREVEEVRHANPDWMLEEGWVCEERPVPCLVAQGGLTRAPVWVRGVATGSHKRLASSDERDRFNPGLPAGVSNGFGVVDVAVPERDRANGNAFSADSVWAIVRMWRVDVRVPVVMLAEDLSTLSPREQLLIYAGWPRARLEEYLVSRGSGLEMPELDVEAMVSGQNTVPYQTQAPGSVKAGMEGACEYCVDTAVRDGTHGYVDYDKDYWIYLLFFQKKNRTCVAEWDGLSYKKGDVLEVVRPLRNYKPFNAAIAKGIPAQWVEFCPTVEKCRQKFPKGCKAMGVHDCKNAFHAMRLALGSRRFAVSKFKDGQGCQRYVMAFGGDQGCSACALFFPVWVRYGYNHFFGTAWDDDSWWTDFVDDTLCFGVDTNEGGAVADCELKMFMLNVVKQLMGLAVSPKQDLSVSVERLFAGLVWTIRGLTCGQEAVDYILSVLGKQPAGIAQARTLRGVIVQAKSVFKFAPTELCVFNRSLAPISAAIEAAKVAKFVWSQECREAVELLATRLVDQPRAYTNPDDVMGEGSCLAILGDADPDAVVTTLWVIQRANAEDVVTADFEEEGRAVILGMHPKTLNKSSSRWHISEKELFAMVLGVRKFGQFVNSVMARWAIEATDRGEWRWLRGQLTVETPKIAFCSDSSSALGMLLTLLVPGGQIDYITPKLMRMMGYADDCACTLYWPMARLLVPGGGEGPCNSLCDYLCRLCGQLRRAQGKEVDEDVDVGDELPYDDSLLVCTTEEVPCVLLGEAGVDDGFELRSLLLADEQWAELHRALEADVVSEWSGVKVRDVYRRLNGRFQGSQTVGQKIDAWEGKVFFAVKRGVEKVLFVRRSCARCADDQVDHTRELVLVIPKGALVAVSRCDMPAAEDQEGREEWEAEDLRTDLLWWAHNGKYPHARKAQTVDRVLSVGWWPGVEVQAAGHYRSCALCLPIVAAEAHVGLGVVAVMAFQVVQMDDKLIPLVLKGKTGYVSVLTFTCVCSGVTVFVLRRCMDAVTAAFAFFKEWVKRFGGCAVMWSDNASEYLSEMMAVVAKLCGVQRRITSARGSHCVYVERKQAVLSKVFYEAEKLGQVQSDQDLELLVTSAEIEVNQVAVTDGSTAMERIGQQPLTSRDMVAPTYDQVRMEGMTAEELAAAVTDSRDRDVAEKVRVRCEVLLGAHRVEQEKRARYNYAHRVAEEGAKGNFDFLGGGGAMRVGDVVSWKGDKWVLLDVRGVKEAEVLLEGGVGGCERKWVVREQVRPLAIERAQMFLPRKEAERRVHEVLAYEVGEEVHLGVVVVIQEGGVMVQVLEPRKGKVEVTWVLQWRDGSGSGVKRAQKCPPGYVAVVEDVAGGEIVGEVELDGNHVLGGDSKNFLEARGVKLDV